MKLSSKRRLALSVAIGLCIASSDAWASVVAQFVVDPTAIAAGGQTTLDLTLQVLADGSEFNASFIGGTATLYDGLGDSQTFNIGAGGFTRRFDTTFTYPNAGAYSPSVSFSASYTENYLATVIISEQAVLVPMGVYCVSRNFFGACTDYQPIYMTEYRPIYGTVTLSTENSTNTSESSALTVEPTPLPAALPLFLTGLGGLGLLSWRSKRRRK